MSDGGFLSPINPCHGRAYVETEVDKIVAHIEDKIVETRRFADRGEEGCDLLAHRLAAVRDGIGAGLHR